MARRDVRTPIGNCNDVPVMSAIGVYVQTSSSVSPFFQQMNLLRTIVIWYRRPVAVLLNQQLLLDKNAPT